MYLLERIIERDYRPPSPPPLQQPAPPPPPPPPPPQCYYPLPQCYSPPPQYCQPPVIECCPAPIVECCQPAMIDYHPPPVADFGYCCGGLTEAYGSTYETWDGISCSGCAGCTGGHVEVGYGGDHELSNINSISMTPNGKYTIIGQSQGAPQIWDALVNKLKVSFLLSITCFFF